MKSSTQIRNELKECTAKVEALDELAKIENRQLTEDETKAIEEVHAEVQALNKVLDTAVKYEAILATKLQPAVADRQRENSTETKAAAVPIRFKSAFRPGVFKNADDAYNSGQWALATIYGSKRAKAYCKDNGIPMRVSNAMTTGDNTKGGFLVPDPLEASIIELREQFGVFGQYAQQVTMGEAVMNMPKLSSDMTSYWVGENSTITASDMAFGLVRLEAKKLAALAAISSELNEDSVVSVAEALARSVAYKFAYDEDNAGFNGDGTSTYGGIVGAANALAAGSVVTATSVTATANLVIGTFEQAVGKLPEYAGIQPRWYFHKNIWANSIQRLLDAVGGNSGMDVANGMPRTFLGYPVVTSQVLYSGTGATGVVFGFFGDLSMAAMLGRRRGMSMAVDNSVYFASDATAIRATERLDINVHDRGTASAAGALLALKFG